jgi:hypothetical protein
VTTRYLDFTGGNDGNDGSSFANRKLTLASAVSGLTGGDTVRVMASAAATSMAQNATWTNASQTVTLTTAVTLNITDCETAWTASLNVTSTASTTTFRENTKSANHVIAAGFVTGLASFFATGTLDLSPYQQVSFWFRSTGTHASGVFTVTLCTDVAGVTAVHTLTVPALTANIWTPVTINNAGALNSAIKSVALNCVSDPGAVTVNIDNIIACKASSSADSLTLTSLISLNTDSNTPWFAIKSINGTSIILGCGDATTAAASSHTTLYMGSTTTATTYKRECVMLTALQTSSANGTNLDTPLNIEGGWDTSAMSSQSDITWLRAKDPSIGCISVTGTSNRLHKLYFVCGGTTGLVFNGATTSELDEAGFAGCRTGWSLQASSGWYANDIRYITGSEVGISVNTASGNDVVLRCKKIWGAGTNSGVAPTGITVTSTGSGNVRAYMDEIKNCRTGVNLNGISWEFYGTVFGSNTTDFAPLRNPVQVPELHDCSACSGTYVPHQVCADHGRPSRVLGRLRYIDHPDRYRPAPHGRRFLLEVSPEDGQQHHQQRNAAVSKRRQDSLPGKRGAHRNPVGAARQYLAQPAPARARRADRRRGIRRDGERGGRGERLGAIVGFLHAQRGGRGRGVLRRMGRDHLNRLVR